MCKLYSFGLGQGIFFLEVNKPLELQITLGSESHVSRNEIRSFCNSRWAYLVKLGFKSFVDGRQDICKDKESNLGSVVGY